MNALTKISSHKWFSELSYDEKIKLLDKHEIKGEPTNGDVSKIYYLENSSEDEFLIKEGFLTGKIDYNSRPIKMGDKLKITVTDNVSYEGKVIYENAAFGIEYFALGALRRSPLCNYAPYCKMEVIA